ncbi:hypothetical protein P879_03605 [Paragonimus westermani]|uniref:PPM-type phosphatase domain-containing protein n=1 Tax=Paragonimus westermani TaxID=34504 RepID=A0A8T0DG62_9TREM|nr:hypothetical protein P879_03605 [Paragonimus westermani]
MGELDRLQEARIPEAEVNKRLSGNELSFTSSQDHLGFSANQVGVNRPVEDRWSAYQFSPNERSLPSRLAQNEGNSTEADGAHYHGGGTVFSVVDGHGGHACAHAINLLLSDYVVSGLIPPHECEQALTRLRTVEESHAPVNVFEFSEVLWSRPEATLTTASEYIGFPHKSAVESDNSSKSPQRWAPWGPWGPLASSVRNVHFGHLRKVLEEILSFSYDGNESCFEDNSLGDICDPDGFLVASHRSIQEAVVANNPNHLLSQPSLPRVLGVTPHRNQSTSAQSLNSAMFTADVAQLHDRVAWLSRTLRDGLRRLDLDMSLSAQPSRRGPTLDKALLRIVFSGCVATTAFIPCSGKELYVAQVGDCGAVLGSFVPSPASAAATPQPPPSTYSPLDWKAELLVEPHNAENEADVQRLKSSHPIHESDFVIRDDRLLGELMPFRAFGDIRFKWPQEELKHVARLLDLPPNYPIMPSFYSTPPYLYSTPQVVWRPLIQHRDHFLILATDGLWDMLSAKEAVNVVAQHWYDYGCNPSLCGPGDTAATRLIRTALGGDTMDPQRISAHFSMPATVARYYRDDISVIVVYLPTSFPSRT